MIAEYFSGVEDSRAPWKVKHNMLEIIVMVITAVAGGCDAWEVIEDFCKVKKEWMKTRLHLKLENGIPSHDTMQRVFGMIKPKEFEKSFCAWMGAVAEKTDGEIISIDGKTLRGSKDGEKKPLHMVSAWANANQLVLGQIATEEKSNEITAVPELIDLLDIEGCTITADAMSCQKEITAKITQGKAEYVLGLKENQPSLYADVKDFWEDVQKHPNQYTDIQTTQTSDKGHGRIEKRKYYLSTEIQWIEQRGKWSNLNGIGMVESQVTHTDSGQITEDRRFFITSLKDVASFSKAARAHWGIENSLHWCLDVVFDEDHIRMRKDNSAENMAVVRHIVLNVLKNYPTTKRMSLSRKRQKCEYDHDFLADVLSFAAHNFHA